MAGTRRLPQRAAWWVMEFRLLGPVEVVINDKPVAIAASRKQITLALLLLEAGHVVSVDRIIDALWGDEPPRTARSQVQITISALRGLLGEFEIVTQPPGYMIKAPPESIDLACFQKLKTSGSRAAAEQRIPEAVTDLRAALALWRGPALEGIQSEVIRGAATRLTESRIAAHQDCLELELQLGRPREIIGELTELVAEHPLNERFRGQLMLALYRGGRGYCERNWASIQAPNCAAWNRRYSPATRRSTSRVRGLPPACPACRARALVRRSPASYRGRSRSSPDATRSWPRYR